MQTLVTLRSVHLNKDHHFIVNGLVEDVDRKKCNWVFILKKGDYNEKDKPILYYIDKIKLKTRNYNHVLICPKEQQQNGLCSFFCFV